MSADNYILTREYEANGQIGFLVTHEFLSDENPSNADEAYRRAMGPNSGPYDGFFDLEEQARDFVDAIYEEANAGAHFIEYGPEFIRLS